MPTDPALVPLTVPGGFRSVLERLQHVAAARPDALALTGVSGTYTYRELMARIDQVATALQERLPAGDEPVGVMIDHDVDVVIIPFALTRLDRVWLNLDPFAPAARIADIAELSGMTACVADLAHRPTVEGLGDRLSVVAAEVAADAPIDPALPAPVRAGQDPFFLVFTSGSTGKPKGVVQTHQQHLNEAYAAAERWGVTADDRLAHFFPVAFVAGPAFAHAALLNGASLHIHDARTHTPRATVDWIRAEALTALVMTPHLLAALTDELGPDERIEGLRAVVTGGEAITGKAVDAFRAHAPGMTFVNNLGSSEACTFAHYIVPFDMPLQPGTLPAGRPVPNRELRIVREDGSFAEVGEVGQLMVVSDYISGGYWRNEAENAKKFGVLPDGRRTYLQGDLGRIDERGILALQGRADTAVKVRGYLVDTSEIEDALRSNEKVSEVLVLPITEEGKPTRLIAYVAQRPAVRPDSVADLRRQLRAKLPEYMVPGTFVLLAAMPRNERGKIDRPNLPQPAEQEVDDTTYTQHELVVGGIWANVLGLEKVPLDGDFLALGGDSLSVEEMLADVGERYGIELPSTELLSNPTLKEFAARVAEGAAAKATHPDWVHLRTGAEDRRVFAFAGAGALALQFLPLARRLDGWDVMAFQAHGLERRALPDWSVQAHARRALTEIRRLQPHGPYRLMGHSFGGMVAYEIAQQLRAAGEQVAVLGVIDTFLPKNAMDELQVTKEFGRMIDRPSPSLLGRIAKHVLPRDASLETTSRLRTFVRLTRARTAGVVRYQGQQQFDTFFYQSVLAGRSYKPQPYAGRALVVNGLGNPTDDAAWEELLVGEHRMVRVDGEHSALMREPHVAQLAAALMEELDASVDAELPAR